MSRLSRSRLVAAAGGLAILAALVPASLSGATPGRGGGPDCTPVLGKPLGGAQAVEALGANIERGAHRAGLTVAEFARELRSDATLRVDVCGYPYYVEPEANPNEVAAHEADGPTGLAGATAADVPAFAQGLNASGDVFALSSRPGSLRTIYLDFTGATVTGTSWNNYAGVTPIAAPAFSLDSDGSTFTVAEQDVVREVWLRVAEDYAPFDVNVTTADPGAAAISRSDAADSTYGTVALITNDSVVYGKCNCGGIAYLGAFDIATTNTYYQPAWVFQRGTGGTAKAMAEAASHEVGHNLGLKHDGTVAHGSVAAAGYYEGHGAWAPIMGAGYYKPVTQWSKGEYQYADNTEDDLAIINSHGVATLPDDHGDSNTGATSVSLGQPLSGIIGTGADADWFKWYGSSGSFKITVQPQAVGADLDARLRLFDSGGALRATSDPSVTMVDSSRATGLDAALTVTLSSGYYYAVVDGVGYGNASNTGYSDYGSLGRYEVTVKSLPAISTSTLPDATALTPYTTTLAATGGTTPYMWVVSGSALPAGLTLSSAGVISGTPTTPGTSSFKVAVYDASGENSIKALSLVIAPAPLTITTTSLPSGRRAISYTATLAASGGTSPYTWSLSAGSLPSGLSLSKGGVISGKPTATGTYTFTVKVTDSKGVVATKSLSLTITS